MMELFERRGDGASLCRAIWARKKEGPWAEALADLAGVLEAELAWLDVDQKRSVRGSAGFGIQELLTTCRPRQVEAGDVVIEAFTKWMATLAEPQLMRICWELLVFDRRHGLDFRECMEPIYSLRKMGRLTGALERESLELAVVLAAEAEAMYHWPTARWAVADWERDSQPYFRALAHDSYAVRAWAAVVIGCMHGKLRKRDSRELMEWFGALEAESAGVTGAFLQGAEWGFGDGPMANLDDGFVRTWFLDVLRRGGKEPVLPHIQQFEFYVHEYFCFDADAIREILRMGKKELALLTATEEPAAIETLRELLDEWAQSDDREISRTIQTYLRERESHAGIWPEED